MERWDLVQPHDAGENQPPPSLTTHCSATSAGQRAFPNTSTLILSFPFFSFFVVLKKKKIDFFLLTIEGRYADSHPCFGYFPNIAYTLGIVHLFSVCVFLSNGPFP